MLREHTALQKIVVEAAFLLSNRIVTRRAIGPELQRNEDFIQWNALRHHTGRNTFKGQVLSLPHHTLEIAAFGFLLQVQSNFIRLLVWSHHRNIKTTAKIDNEDK